MQRQEDGAIGGVRRGFYPSLQERREEVKEKVEKKRGGTRHEQVWFPGRRKPRRRQKGEGGKRQAFATPRT